jgi:hypothetical protein
MSPFATTIATEMHKINSDYNKNNVSNIPTVKKYI